MYKEKPKADLRKDLQGLDCSTLMTNLKDDDDVKCKECGTPMKPSKGGEGFVHSCDCDEDEGYHWDTRYRCYLYPGEGMS